MMNNTLFSNIVTAITNLDDVQGAQLLSIINGMTNVSSSPNPTTKISKAPKKSKEFKGTPKDISVAMTVDKNKVSLSAYTKKDVWEVLKRRFTLVGGTYDKTVKVITFKTQKDAKAFASNNVVTADERQAIWTEWRAK